MNRKHRRLLEAIFERPTRANLVWSDIEALFLALGADIREGRGSRVRFTLNGCHGYFHRPHPGKEAKKGAVDAVREFLENAGIET